ncbi:MAG TPA: HEAT repeat domain-containing protein [Candidatus Acidoferrum sp.]|jgi:hypothetical protein
MSAGEKLRRCAEVAPLLVFYVCDEVSGEEREQIDAHLSGCADCMRQLSDEIELQSTLTGGLQSAEKIDPAGVLLAQCRSELSETLDDLAAPATREHWSPFGWMRQWMALRPAWSAAALILLGLLVGTQALPWLALGGGGNDDATKDGQPLNVMAASRLSDEDLAKMQVAGVNFAPDADSAPGTLQLQVRTEQPVDLRGNLDDMDVRRVLVYVVANGERFDPGVRLDCLDALKSRAGDAEVRGALLAAARKDANAAVRIKALESLRDYAAEESVREALLESLQRDTNPGVRVEAVNLLVRSLEGETVDAPDAQSASDSNGASGWRMATPAAAGGDAVELASGGSMERVVRVLEELQRRDPSRYVRLRSAAALRQIGPRELQ